MSEDELHTWNHRVILHDESPADPYYAIHEVHYTDGEPHSVTMEPTAVIAEQSEGIDSLRQTLQWMLRCLDQPVLRYNDFGEDGYRNQKQ